ncbi:uncharacterized protein C8Q71DRAFT_154337 [Rhodofomes roseus]|uniref:F-box domain-containing protein n=1 Tax=Rhodofomes roseus TaxID=34475 RepID=A0ABQ8KAI7_9APHY|nr:uncharacterized protein C8Q71DRAFT_154337 [Rhodofomes roseus]KAH9833960.1 hypothetical protein C8Q71DRAFT_154337 [Rhodofomes roseus]
MMHRGDALRSSNEHPLVVHSLINEECISEHPPTLHALGVSIVLAKIYPMYCLNCETHGYGKHVHLLARRLHQVLRSTGSVMDLRTFMHICDVFEYLGDATRNMYVHRACSLRYMTGCETETQDRFCESQSSKIWLELRKRAYARGVRRADKRIRHTSIDATDDSRCYPAHPLFNASQDAPSRHVLFPQDRWSNPSYIPLYSSVQSPDTPPKQRSVSPVTAPHDHLFPDDVDWANYYWGFPRRADGRRPMLYSLPRRITDRIPIELIDIIISFLGDDRRTLRACMSVCRHWYGTSVRFFYSDISLCSRRQFDQLVRISRQFPSVRTLLHRTRSLSISPSDNDRSFFHATPLVLAPFCPNVESLTLQGCPRREAYHSFKFAQSLHRFKRVTHLALRSFALGSIASLTRIICALPALTELELARGIFAGPSAQRNTGRPAFTVHCPASVPKLKRLTIISLETNLLERLADWLVSSNACESITFLCVEQDFAVNLTAITELLQAVRPSIEQLRLIDSGPGYPCCLFMLHGVNLRFLQLGYRALNVQTNTGTTPSSLRLVDQLHQILSSLLNCHLERLSLIVDLSSAVEYYGHKTDRLDWTPHDYQMQRELLALIGTPCFNRLADVDVQFSVAQDRRMWNQSEFSKAMRIVMHKTQHLLRPWHDRNILDVSCRSRLSCYGPEKHRRKAILRGFKPRGKVLVGRAGSFSDSTPNSDSE